MGHGAYTDARMSHDRGSGRLQQEKVRLRFRGGLAALTWACGPVRYRLRGVPVAMTVARYFMASVAVELRLDRAVDRGEPVAVLWAHAAHDLGVYVCCSVSVSAPILPVPTGRWSTSMTGRICAPVPVRKISSATYSSVRSI